MIVLGIVLLVLGLLFDLGLLVTLGVILAVLGAIVYLIAAATGKALFGRRKHYY